MPAPVFIINDCNTIPRQDILWLPPPSHLNLKLNLSETYLFRYLKNYLQHKHYVMVTHFQNGLQCERINIALDELGITYCFSLQQC